MVKQKNKTKKKINTKNKTLKKKIKNTCKNIPKHYFASLSLKDKLKQCIYIKKSRKAYNKKVYIPRPILKSYKNKKSNHVIDFQTKYNLNLNQLTKISKLFKIPVSVLKKVLEKGRGAYFSQGSRPNQTGESWARARLASVLLGRNACKIDQHLIEEKKQPNFCKNLRIKYQK